MIRALVVAVIVLAAAGRADAYPHFQLTSGTVRCSYCHSGPAGGGPLEPWGQEEAGDTIARGGDGRFLHGAITLPASVLLGGDLRIAALANDTGSAEGVEVAAFPMQADVSVRLAFGSVAVAATVGLRGIARSGAPTTPTSDASEQLAGPSMASYLVSREHYVMWRPQETGVFARVGRFAAPYGLRLVDHTAYVRRYLGFNLLEETYGASGGVVEDDWELHVTGFAFDPLQFEGPREVGGALTAELHTSTSWVLGASTRLGVGEHATRLSAGLHGKVFLDGPALLFQVQADAVRQLFEGPGDRWQLASYAGPVWIPTQGLYVGIAHQAFAEDLEIRAVTRHAGELWLSMLPRAHFEVMLTARAQWLGPHERSYLSLLQLHYSL